MPATTDPPGSAPALLPGVCSVTFRDRSIEEVASLAAGAGLVAVEWGGDVHVPRGDLVSAEHAAGVSAAVGLDVVSYGSYLFCDAGVADRVGAVLDTTEALGAPLVRVWCPLGVEPDADAATRAEVTEAVWLVAEAAAARGLAVCLEYHGGTLTATVDSTLALLDQVHAPNLLSAWQPAYWAATTPDVDDDVAAIERLGARLAHVHVYQWDHDLTRHPLADGLDRWPARLRAASDAPPTAPRVPRAALIEFVVGDRPSSLEADAAVLRSWLEADGGLRVR